MLTPHADPVIERIDDPLFRQHRVEVFIKREDLLHPYVSGNKWRKLKYNLIEAQTKGYRNLLTFGGAYSNHIYATAAAARESGFRSIGIIRGDELRDKPLNPTLSFAKGQGMQFHFVSREEYRKRHDKVYLEELSVRFGDCYIIPEGGTNQLAIKGCEEILNTSTQHVDIIACAVGTGGTIAGIISAKKEHQTVIGFSALKGGFLADEVKALLQEYDKPGIINWRIEDSYHFGGYAKMKPALANFMTDFEARHRIPLDPIYTGKMVFGMYDMITNDRFEKGTRILMIHTGGLQGRKCLLPAH